MVAIVQNISSNPPTAAVKWQRNNKDINITDTKYIGSTEDLVSPKLVINGVDFVNDHLAYYRCVATNSEGSWTASARIYVYDSKFIQLVFIFCNIHVNKLNNVWQQFDNISSLYSNSSWLFGNMYTEWGMRFKEISGLSTEQMSLSKLLLPQKFYMLLR